eukprot:122209_1
MSLHLLCIYIITILTTVQSFHYFERVKTYDHSCNVMDYGAKGDGSTNDTKAVQDAINSCFAHGSSSQVYLPSSKTFLVGPLTIQQKCDNCAFTINSSSTLLFSNDRSKWPNNMPCLTIEHQTNFIFEGPGTVDGQGKIWWQHRDDFRPKLMEAHSSSHVVITNILIKNCPDWCLMMATDYTEIFNIHIQNPPSILKNSNDESHNTDGVDVFGQPFYIHDCTINTGDDNVAIKNANDTLIENCHFGSGHGASIGSLDGGWFTNITVRNVVFDGTTPAARIKIHNDAGVGKLWNVLYSNLTMKDVSQAITISEYYDGNKNETCKFQIEDITLENIKASVNASKNVGQIACQPSKPCKSITLKNITITGGKQSWQCNEASVSVTDVSPKVNCIN